MVNKESNAKTIAISLPCYNEENNILKIIEELEEIFKTELKEYNYIIQFSDNCSTDNTREILRKSCIENKHVRAIFNSSNVSGSAIHSILQVDGDCCIHMASDLQDPPKIILDLVKKWQEGCGVVCAIKEASEESKLMWNVRSLYYRIMKRFSFVNQIQHFTGFGLYDRGFIEIIRRVEDPLITLRGLVAEFGYKIGKVYYKQPKRRHGKSKQNFIRNFDYAMRSFTTYTKIGLHLAVLGGVSMMVLNVFITLLLLIICALFNINININYYLIISIIVFFGSFQIFLIGLIGEYIGNINIRLLKRPLAIEEERIGNWGNSNAKSENTSPYNVMFPLK